jgi:hypothetical protein
MIRVSKLLPLAFLIGLAGCADSVRVTKMDLELNTYEITPSVPWVSFRANDEELKQQISQASAGLCGPNGIALLDVERPAYIRVPMSPRGYLYCR